MRALLFETVTGKPVVDLECTDWSTDTGILAPDSVEVTVPAYTARSRSMDLRSLLVRDKFSVAVIDESVAESRYVVAAGPIVQAVPAEDAGGNHAYKVSCRGVERLFESRHVRLFPGWPLIGADLKPTGAFDQSFKDLSYGTIMKRLLVESEKFPGGSLPISYEPDRAGVHERNEYHADKGIKVLEAIDDLADLSDGVEYDFRPVIDEFDNVTYEFVTGTDSGRVVSRDAGLVWNLGGVMPDIRGYERVPDPSPVYTEAIFAGGKDDDTVLLARAQDSAPLSDGFPRAELWDSSHSTVTVQSTLQSWADRSLTKLPDRVRFEVRAQHAHGIRHGDMGELASLGHWDMHDGIYPVRVLSVSRSSSDPGWVAISLV